MRYGKKLIHCFIVSAFMVLNVHGQETEKKSSGKWKVGLSFSPDYCYRTLKTDSYPQILKDRNEIEISKFGYTAGASILWRVHKKVELESGIFYSDKGYKTTKRNLSWVSNDISTADKYRVVFRYQYFDIPFKLNYYLIHSKVQLFVTGGIFVDIFNRAQTKLILEENGSQTSILSENDLGFSTLNISVLAGIGVIYPVSKSWSVRIQPIYRRSLTSLRPATDIKEKLFSTGMEVGLFYTL